ncbi:MAG: potassium channel protein [Deltaproteobacteria bacterium]|nr:potassium channel protein [Deltaproteobacteria bacterium]
MIKTWLSATFRHAGPLLVLPIALIGIGTAGFMFLQDYSLLEALYMTIITLSTVGFGEIKPLDQTGRIFTIVLILTGATFVAYQLTYFSQLMLDMDLLDLVRRRRLKKQLEQMHGHYVVCGFGQMGQIIVDELIRGGIPVVVVDNDESLLVRLREKGILHLLGDATEEENLLEAGIKRADGLVSVVNKDTDNVYIVLTARDLNKDLLIFARAGTPYTEKRLFQAGANRVVSPFAIGAIRIAHNILRPTVTDFLELALSGEGMELTMEELRIPDGAELVGKELMHSGIRSQYNLIVVAIKRADGQMVYNPSPLEVLQAGDIMVVIGPQENLARFGGAVLGCPLPTFGPCKS